MQTGTVQEIGLSKSGKPKVKVDNQWYSIKGTLGMVPGQRIEFEAHEFQFNGKQFWGIDKYGLVPTSTFTNATQASQAGYAPMTPNTAPIGASPPMSSPVGYTEPERMFVSNIVAAAVTAGQAKDPVDLLAWASAALTALRHMTDVPAKSPIVEFDKDVGF